MQVYGTVSHVKLKTRLFVLTLILLMIAASRFPRVPTHDLHPDEVWSVWQTFGSVNQIIQWTPFDWFPPFYLTVGAWRVLVGIQPESLLTLTIFVFMLGAACLYRVTRRLFNEYAAWCTLLAYGALGYNIYLSIFLRSHVFVLSLGALALWLAVRYFEHPSHRRGIYLGLALTAMFYMHVTAIFGMVTIAVFTLILYPRRLRRWILPTLIVIVLCIPLSVSKLRLAAGRAAGTAQFYNSPDFMATIIKLTLDIYHDFLGYNVGLWLALMVIAAILFLADKRWLRRSLSLAMWILSLFPLLFVAPLFGALQTRLMPWIMIGIAMWIGWGLSYLPRRPMLAVGLVLVALMFGPVPILEKYQPRVPVTATFRQFAQQAQWGDVMVVDPNSTEVAPEEWDYYRQIYFPQGFQFVDSPGNTRRVWYAFDSTKPDTSLHQDISTDREQQLSLGERTFTLQLYVAPPDITGIPFANGMRFHGADLLEKDTPVLARRTGETLHIRLWWSVDHAMTQDYSVGTYLIGDSGLLGQFDGPPQVTNLPRETSQWVPGRYYVEERAIPMNYPTYDRHADIYLAVYEWWGDQQRITAPGMTAEKSLRLFPVDIQHWLTPR